MCFNLNLLSFSLLSCCGAVIYRKTSVWMPFVLLPLLVMMLMLVSPDRVGDGGAADWQ